MISFDALDDYHAREARLWERQALLRARPVAGDETLFSRAFAQVLEPSVFRPIDRGAAAKELLAMRDRMEREIAGESDGLYNSKLGRGGLVDVEFAAQFGVRNQLRRRILRQFEQEGIEIPFPSRTVYLRSDPGAPEVKPE